MPRMRLSSPRLTNISFELALEEFIEILKAKGRSTVTIEDYQWNCTRFYSLYPHFPDVGQMKRGASIYLTEKISPYTYNLRLTYNKCFFRYCVEQGYLSENPMLLFKVKRTEPRIVQHSSDVLIKLLQQPDLKTYVGLRDYAMLLLTLDTGIRPSELRKLMPEDFDPNKGLIFIPAEISKVRKSRTLPIQPTTISFLRRLQACKPDSWTNAPIFCNNEGTMMLAWAWQARLKLYSRSIGQRIRPYDLRHDFALLYLKNGGNVFTLQKMMGHSTLEMTRRYIDIDSSELKRMASIASPLNTLITTKKRLGKI